MLWLATVHDAGGTSGASVGKDERLVRRHHLNHCNINARDGTKAATFRVGELYLTCVACPALSFSRNWMIEHLLCLRFITLRRRPRSTSVQITLSDVWYLLIPNHVGAFYVGNIMLVVVVVCDFALFLILFVLKLLVYANWYVCFLLRACLCVACCRNCVPMQ